MIFNKKRSLYLCLLLLFSYRVFPISRIQSIYWNNKYYVIDDALTVVMESQEPISITNNNLYIVSFNKKAKSIDVYDYYGKFLFSNNIGLSSIFQFTPLCQTRVLIQTYIDKDYLLDCETKVVDEFESGYLSSLETPSPSNDLIATSNGTYYSCLKKKEVFKECNFSKVYPYSNNRAVVLTADGYAVINQNGEIISDFFYDIGEYYSNGLLAVKDKNHNTFFVDEDCNKRISYRLLDFERGPKEAPVLHYYFDQDVCAIQTMKNEWIIIDKQGNTIKTLKSIQPASYQVYSNSLLGIYSENEKKCGYINSSGEITIPLVLDSVSKFIDGIAVVNYNQEKGILMTNGNFYFMKDLIEGKRENFINLKN